MRILDSMGFRLVESRIKGSFLPCILTGYLSCLSYKILPGTRVIVDCITDVSSIGVSLYCRDNNCHLSELVHGSFVDHYYVLPRQCLASPSICDEYIASDCVTSLAISGRSVFTSFSERVSQCIVAWPSYIASHSDPYAIFRKILVVDNTGGYCEETQYLMVESLFKVLKAFGKPQPKIEVRPHPRLGVGKSLSECMQTRLPVLTLTESKQELSDCIRDYDLVIFLSDTNAWKECVDTGVFFAFLNPSTILASELMRVSLPNLIVLRV
jgi:hypothetical protein